MAIPDILALDFDGVLCDGMREYFETSRRAFERVWPRDPAPGDDLFPPFRDLRPVILSGWEMPVLLRAIAEGRSQSVILAGWEAVRDGVVASSVPSGNALVDQLKHAVDDVRRDWIGAAPDEWLALNVPYCQLDELQRVVSEPARAQVVTTKEGEFARQILDRWNVHLAGIQGKEAGIHKCENLRTLIAEHIAARGRRPTVWFVEDRLETLEHVTTHADLADVGLFLAAWGYNTPATRDAAKRGGRVRLLELSQFRRGLSAWP